MKKVMVFLLAATLGLSLAACEGYTIVPVTTTETPDSTTVDVTTTISPTTTLAPTTTIAPTTTEAATTTAAPSTTAPVTTTAEPTTTGPTTTAFAISLSGLDPVGFTEEDVLYAGTEFDLLEGVHAYGSDEVDYKAQIIFNVNDAACQITDGILTVSSPKTCSVEYTIVVQSKVDREWRDIKFSQAPVTGDYVEVPDVFAATTMFDTDYALTFNASDPTVNEFFYWAESNDILGDTGSVQVLDGKLVIAQETVGSVDYAIQVRNKTDISLIQNQEYAIKFQLTSTTNRYIDIVTKAPNNDYDNDTHSIIEVLEGTNEYTMYFKANQDALHLNIMTGKVEGIENTAAGTLTFWDFKLFVSTDEVEEPEEPLYDYRDVPDGITNGDFADDTIPLNDVASSWISWTTVDQGSWTTPVDATFAFVEGKMRVETLGVGEFVWSIQLGYRALPDDFKVIPGRHYKVEFDVHASVAGTFNFELTTTDDAANIPFVIELEAGDNHVVVEFEAYEEKLMLTAALGLYGAAVLTFDNFELAEEILYEYEPVENGIFNGDFDAEGFGVGLEGSGWSSWTTVDQGSWTTPVDADIEVVDGKIVVETLGVGEFVWSIQLQYRPGDLALAVMPGQLYRITFDVHATVAGTFSMELTTAGDAGNIAIPVELEVGDNHIVVEYIAYQPELQLTAALGQYGEAVLTFDNFQLYKRVEQKEIEFHEDPVPAGITNGDFADDTIPLNDVASSWISWTTVDQGSWTTPVDATFAFVEGKMRVETLGVGDYVWSIQLGYRALPDDFKVVVGRYYRVEFDVNASVAGTFSFELTTTDNVANIPFAVELEAGDNHVVVEFKAYEERLMLTCSLGLYGAAVLIFDNFTITEEIVYAYDQIVGGIYNGDFDAVGFEVNGVESGWSSWTTVDQGSWTTPVDADIEVVEGAVVVETLGVGDFVWSIQFQYRPGTLAPEVIPGNVYRVSFDVHASVAGVFSMELTTQDNVGNIPILVPLVVGDNHVVVEYVAFQPELQLTASLGQYGAAILTFDNFQLFERVIANDYSAE